MRVFVDTNLWVYRLDQRDPKKSGQISQWLRDLAAEHDIVVSTQVLIELGSVLTRKLKPPFGYEDVRTALSAVASFDVVAMDQNLVLDALVLGHLERLAWVDALIVEAAIRSGCSVLYSEDISHGRRYSELLVCNPFLEISG